MKHQTTAIFTGTDVAGVQGTGEVLTTGAAVRVITHKNVAGVRFALVDLPGAFAGRRTYTVWSVEADLLR